MADISRQLSALIRRDGPNCHYCGKPVTKRTRSRDHVVPRSLYGPNSLDNLVLAHKDCNVRRGNKIDKCWCSFCQKANERWLNEGLWRLRQTELPRPPKKVRRSKSSLSDAEQTALFRSVWTRTDKGV